MLFAFFLIILAAKNSHLRYISSYRYECMKQRNCCWLFKIFLRKIWKIFLSVSFLDRYVIRFHFLRLSKTNKQTSQFDMQSWSWKFTFTDRWVCKNWAISQPSTSVFKLIWTSSQVSNFTDGSLKCFEFSTTQHKQHWS